MTLDLSVAGYAYDWTAPLYDGRVSPQGVDLAAVDFPNPQRFTRMVDREEFDVCELSMGTYLASRARAEDYPFTALPVFPYRRFRHSFVYVRDGAGIDAPADLAGRRVGLVNWQTTTGIWQRGILVERHGLALDEVEWVVSGAEIAPVDPTVDVEYLDSRRGSALPLLEDRLESGDLDALMVPIVPETDAAVGLFDDPVAVEREYARETGIFPVMHTVVVRDDVLAEHPWVAQSLFDAFAAAKEVAMDRLAEPRSMPLAWVRPLVDEQRAILGEDPWQYGLAETNRRTLETLVGYAHDQGVAAERYALEDLFATDHLAIDWFGDD